MLHTETLRDVEQEQPQAPPMVEMGLCPMCEAPAELQDYAPSLEEVEQTDPFGVAYGQAGPRGEDLIEVVPPEYFYPQNGGIGYEPHECKVWASKIPRDLDWIVSHYPEADWVRRMIQAKSSRTIRFSAQTSGQSEAERRLRTRTRTMPS